MVARGGQFVLIGGGDLATLETFALDKYAVDAVGRNRPNALCISAASGDSREVCEAFGYVYADHLRCRTDFLRLIKGEPLGDDFQRKIDRTNLIYLADGDPGLLIEALRQYKVEAAIEEALRRGIVVCALGGGATVLGPSGLGFTPVDLAAAGQLTEEIQASADESGRPCYYLEVGTALDLTAETYRFLSIQPNSVVRRYRPQKPADEMSMALECRPVSELG